jgi:thiol-disulfide isomerase/thioredoxin
MIDPRPRRRRTLSIAAATLILLTATSWAEPGNPVGTLTLEALDGMIHQEGNRLVLAVMAAWCHPCIKELPVLNDLHARYSARGLNLVGISVDFDGPQAMQPVVDQHKVRFPVFWIGEAALKAYQIRSIPLLIFIRDGQVVEKVVGQRKLSDLDKRVRDLLAR